MATTDSVNETAGTTQPTEREQMEAEIKKLRAELEGERKKNAALVAGYGRGLSPEEMEQVRVKIASGLNQEQAVGCVLRQRDFDRKLAAQAEANKPAPKTSTDSDPGVKATAKGAGKQ